MSTTDDSYLQMLNDYRARDNYDAVFRSCMDDLAAKVDFSWVRSCIAFGTGTAEHEILFARRVLPNLQEFTAVEPDPDSLKKLRANFQDGQLPGVQTSIIETAVEDWGGVDCPVDAVLFFNIIFHVQPVNRQLIYRNLMTKYLKPDGIVVIVENGTPVTYSFIRMMQRLGDPLDNWYRDIEAEFLAAGFQRDLVYDFVCKRDLSSPTDGIVKFIQIVLFENKVSEEEIRSAISDLYGHPDTCVDVIRKMGVFRNPART